MTIITDAENIEMKKYCAGVTLQTAWAEYIKEYRKELGTFGYMSDGSFYVLKHESKLDDLRQAVANASITVQYLNMQK